MEAYLPSLRPSTVVTNLAHTVDIPTGFVRLGTEGESVHCEVAVGGGISQFTVLLQTEMKLGTRPMSR